MRKSEAKAYEENNESIFNDEITDELACDDYDYADTEEKEFAISIHSQRTCLDGITLDMLDCECLVDMTRHKVYSIFIDVKDVDTNEKAAEMVFNVLNFASYEAQGMIEEADCISVDMLTYARSLATSALFSRDEYDYDLTGGDMNYDARHDNMVNGAIHRWYVHPKYRKMGLGRKLLNNIDKLLLGALDLRLRCVTVLVNPDTCDDREAIEKTMKKLLREAKFKRSKDGLYIKDFLEDCYLGK